MKPTGMYVYAGVRTAQPRFRRKKKKKRYRQPYHTVVPSHTDTPQQRTAVLLSPPPPPLLLIKPKHSTLLTVQVGFDHPLGQNLGVSLRAKLHQTRRSECAIRNSPNTDC